MSSSHALPNGHDAAPVPHVPMHDRPARTQMSKRRSKMLLEQLAVPFDPREIQWRIVETAKVFGRLRGRVIPYADRLAYLRRLNDLFTPAGWRSDLWVHHGMAVANERGRATPGKVVVTCQVTIHGLGSHCSTGEDWAENENAATSAEAQAFKRSCANFGLGAYLYYFFRGVWVDLDSNRQMQAPPPLPDWATPQGWEAGARPDLDRLRDGADAAPEGFDQKVIRDIEAMQNDLGRDIYRRILKRYLVWEPRHIRDAATAGKVLEEMKRAAPLMLKIAQALERVGRPAFDDVLHDFQLKSVADFGELGVLEQVAEALEEKLSIIEAG